MQRLDAAAEHLGHVGERVDRRDREAELGDVRGGSPARDELDASSRGRWRTRSRPVLSKTEMSAAHGHQGWRALLRLPDRADRIGQQAVLDLPDARVERVGGVARLDRRPAPAR